MIPYVVCSEWSCKPFPTFNITSRLVKICAVYSAITIDQLQVIITIRCGFLLFTLWF